VDADRISHGLLNNLDFIYFLVYEMKKPIFFFKIGGDGIFSHFLPRDEFFENRGKNELKNSIAAAIF
jgi:hypothetical protein